MENKTKEQKQASINRFIAQKNKALEMLSTNNLYDYINGLKYAYSLSLRYRSVNLKRLVESQFENPFNVPGYLSPREKCLKCKILKPWNDTYWFDKEKAESLLNYISEHTTNRTSDS